jgi:hypothetical protein
MKYPLPLKLLLSYHGTQHRIFTEQAQALRIDNGLVADVQVEILRVVHLDTQATLTNTSQQPDSPLFRRALRDTDRL